MLKLKLIKHPEENPDPSDPLKLNEIYEGFEVQWGNELRYALNVNGKFVYFAPKEECEIIEEEPRLIISTEENENHSEVLKRLNKEGLVTVSSNIIKEKILIVEDGSVDIDDLEEWCNENNIKLIVYRSGANPPAWLN